MINVKENFPEKRRRGRPEGTTAPRSDAVRLVREFLGWSQDRLARELEISNSAVRLAEREGRLFQKREVMEKFAKLAKEAGVALP